MLPMNRHLHQHGDPCIRLVDHLFCGRNHENGPGPVRSLGGAENAHVHVRNTHEVVPSRSSRYADDAIRRRVTRGDYGRNHFDRRLRESEVAIGTSYHRVSGNVASPDGDG